MRSIVLLLSVVACGVSTVVRQELAFEIHRVEVGFESADVVVVDWDGDGHLDLLVSGGERIVQLRGDGTGQFELSGSAAAGENPVDIVLGDVNEDGRTDVVVANHETDYLTLLMGGAEDFASSRSQRLPIDVSPHPHAVAVEDINGDGHLDIVVDDRDRERLQVHVGSGDGSFEMFQAIEIGADPYRGMTVADIDGDGHVDVITPNPRTVSVQMGDGQGGFSHRLDLESSAMPPFSTVVGDFDGDGVLDIASGSGESQGEVRVWLGTGGGGYSPNSVSSYRIAEGPTAMSVSDVNGDGIDDIVAASYVGNGLAILLGGDPLEVIRIGLEDNPWNVAMGDLNEDGLMDVVTTNDSGSRITVLLQRPSG